MTMYAGVYFFRGHSVFLLLSLRWWKNFENRSTFGKVMGASRVACFLTDWVDNKKASYPCQIFSVITIFSIVNMLCIQTEMLFYQFRPSVCPMPVLWINEVMFYQQCQTILSQSDQCYFCKNCQASIRGGDPWAGKKQMMFVVWTIAKKLFAIVRFCSRTIPNEII